MALFSTLLPMILIIIIYGFTVGIRFFTNFFFQNCSRSLESLEWSQHRNTYILVQELSIDSVFTTSIRIVAKTAERTPTQSAR